MKSRRFAARRGSRTPRKPPPSAPVSASARPCRCGESACARTTAQTRSNRLLSRRVCAEVARPRTWGRR
ncbi:hypothetical protein [Lysobacter gummosus]|uniref:hypothetical protein n=1 Tax=Lysobacter gummosus TaxID=262324 RepID=UPI00364481B4